MAVNDSRNVTAGYHVVFLVIIVLVVAVLVLLDFLLVIVVVLVMMVMMIMIMAVGVMVVIVVVLDAVMTRVVLLSADESMSVTSMMMRILNSAKK